MPIMQIMQSMVLLPRTVKPASDDDSDDDSEGDSEADSYYHSVPDSAADSADESEGESSADIWKDAISRRDPSTCSALLRNPAFMNPLAAFTVVKMVLTPSSDMSKREMVALMALEFFILLIGDNTSLVLKEEPDFPRER